MAYDVASSINDLLFENETVIIPDFGGFELNGHPASIDYIKSKMAPPSKIAVFNNNLKINDGVLVNYIKTQNNCSLEQANQIISDFVTETQEKIEKKEIIEFPKVGRLYKDYNNTLQFLPYDTNFDTNVFGLPILEVHPFSRNKQEVTAIAEPIVEKATAATSTFQVSRETNSINSISKLQKEIAETETKLEEEEKVATIPVGSQKGIFKWAQMTMPLLIAASIAVIALSFFFFRKGKTQASNSDDVNSSMAINDSKKINTAPSIDEAEITTLPDDDSVDNADIDYAEENEEEETESASVSNTSDESNAGFSNDCIVIVGQFSVKSNARKFASKIENDGYESYMGWNDSKGWNTVGVKFSYETKAEKEDMLRLLKNQYDDAAWILRE